MADPEYIGIVEGYHCDFCAEENPKWEIPAVDIYLGVAPSPIMPDTDEKHYSMGSWAACSECVKFIQTNDRSGLLDYAVNSYMTKYGALGIERAVVVGAVGQAHMAFWEAKTGEPVYVGKVP